MNKLAATAIVFLVTLMTAIPTFAQQARVSPADIASAAIDGSRVMVVYCRPFSKDPTSGQIRKIWGTLVPYNTVWRFGANEATHLITPQPLTIGGTTIPAGTYTLFMLPAESGAKLIINKQIGQLGTEYDEKQDVARVDMTKSALPEAVNQLTVAITPNPTGGGTINVKWENTQFSVPVSVKK